MKVQVRVKNNICFVKMLIKKVKNGFKQTLHFYHRIDRKKRVYEQLSSQFLDKTQSLSFSLKR